ncbi:MAG: helix-hairpin-helix domain-containing protein [Burkholderiales bacterium]|nr:helix-hairpin-helix domain-containing protein [Burkholderiales bacterium]
MKKLLFILLAWLAVVGAAFAAVNINTASKEELMTLNGVGEVKAKAIIDYRTKNGPFKSVDEVNKVPGIGEGILSKIRSDVTLTGKTTVASPVKEDKAAGKKADAKDAKKADKKAEKTADKSMSKVEKSSSDKVAKEKASAEKSAKGDDKKAAAGRGAAGEEDKKATEKKAADRKTEDKKDGKK